MFYQTQKRYVFSFILLIEIYITGVCRVTNRKGWVTAKLD